MSLQAMWRILAPDHTSEASMTMHTPAEVEVFVTRLSQPYQDTAMIEHTDRPLLNPEFGVPDHSVFVAVANGYGYLGYQDPATVHT